MAQTADLADYCLALAIPKKQIARVEVWIDKERDQVLKLQEEDKKAVQEKYANIELDLGGGVKIDRKSTRLNSSHSS